MLRKAAARAARRSAGIDSGFALEQLEPRQMLAVTITQDVIRSGEDIVYADATSITIADGVILNAGGGNITLTAPVITIGDGAKLLSKGISGGADGAITLTAKSQTSNTPSSLYNQFVNIAQWAGLPNGKAASIDVGRDVCRSCHSSGACAAVGDLGAEAIAGHAGRPTPSRRRPHEDLS